MNEAQFFEDLFQRLRDVIARESLQQLDQVLIDEQHPRTFFAEVTKSRSPHTPLPIFLYHDLFYASNDLLHFTAWLFLLRPRINNATEEGGTYHQNWYDSKYLSYAWVLDASIYKFWDRIGDLLSSYFQTGLAPDRVYIGRVLNNFPSEKKDSIHYKRLVDIFRKRVRPILKSRDDDSHNLSLSTRFYFDTLIASGEEQAELVSEKLQMPETYKEQILLAYEGLIFALRLIKEKGDSKE